MGINNSTNRKIFKAIKFLNNITGNQDNNYKNVIRAYKFNDIVSEHI